MVFNGMVYPTRQVHTCTKQTHSCYRNIVSFARFPGKHIFKMIARALTHVILQHVNGWATISKRGVAALAHSCSDRRCLRCRHRMESPTNVVYDAGQAYETLKWEWIERDLDKSIQLSIGSGTILVQVLKAARAITGRCWPI